MHLPEITLRRVDRVSELKLGTSRAGPAVEAD